jgi:transposase-like protein
MVHGAAVRDRKKERVWRKIIRGRRDGVSIRAYCRARGVKEATFYWWRRELARRDTVGPTAAFVPVVLRDSQATAIGTERAQILECRLKAVTRGGVYGTDTQEASGK